MLPGGTRAAALAHVARTVCRRAERTLVHAGRDRDRSREPARRYLNRLSDLLFVLARALNRAGGRPDVLWREGPRARRARVTARGQAAPPDRNARLADLLARTALADQAAFGELYRATSSHLYGVALRILREPAAAEEILQEAYVNVWHHAGSYAAAKSQPLTWLTAIVRNRCLDQLRRRELDTVSLTADDDDDADFELPGDGHDARRAADRRRRRALGARLRRRARGRQQAGDRAGVLPGPVARRARRASARAARHRQVVGAPRARAAASNASIARASSADA